MSIVTPKIIPKSSIFPRLLAPVPRKHPVPVPKNRRVYENLNSFRDLQKEMDDLSEEENELEDLTVAVHNRGFSFLVPIGRTFTQQEEKNDADEDESDGDSESEHSGTGGPPSVVEDEDAENDLDASLEDMDEDEQSDEDDSVDEDDQYGEDDDEGDEEELNTSIDDGNEDQSSSDI